MGGRILDISGEKSRMERTILVPVVVRQMKLRNMLRCGHSTMAAVRYCALQKLQSAIGLTKGTSHTWTALFLGIA